MSLAARLLERWIPSPLARRALREAQEELLWQLHCAMPPPRDGEDPILKAMEGLGEALGEPLRDRLGLPDDRRGAARAWRITSRLGGLRLRVREEQDRTVFDHEHCPLWARFRQEGEISCPRFCEPVARGIARVVAPSCRMVITRPASLDSPCAKALVDG